MSDGPARDWWELVEEHLAKPEHAVDDDPWSDCATAPALTEEQRALLGGDDQPQVPRFEHGHGTDDQPPVPRLARPRADEPDDDAPGSTTGNMPGDTP
jgi:hypothetical protein